MSSGGFPMVVFFDPDFSALISFRIDPMSSAACAIWADAIATATATTIFSDIFMMVSWLGLVDSVCGWRRRLLLREQFAPHFNGRFKILGNGDISRKLTVQVSHVSSSAREKIEKAGGTVASV